MARPMESGAKPRIGIEIGRWRENMIAEERQIVGESLHGLLLRLGYA